MKKQAEIILDAKPRGFHLVTNEIMKKISEAGLSLPETGILSLFVKHCSCGITINENYDPSVRSDFESTFNCLVPENQTYYTHTLEGSDDMPAHIKAALTGSSLNIPITNKQLNMGT